jgi:predicted dehydrogenase
VSDRKLRVGIIGADASASWAGAAHVPALRTQPSLELAAVATRREDSAKAAAEAFGVARWYADPYALIADDSLDIVTVAVKVPAHRALVLAAMKAGKAVYSESPLGASLAETEEMAAASGALHTAIGLQAATTLRSAARPSWWLRGDLVGSCRHGSRRQRSDMARRQPAPTTTSTSPRRGASFMTITVGHVLDVVEAVLGDIVEVDARTALLWPEIEVIDTGETSFREVCDHADIIATTVRGASVSAQVLAGVAPEQAGFRFEVRGADGWLTLTGDHLAGVQVGDLTLSASVSFDAPDAPLASGVEPTAAAFWAGAAINVGEIYASLARDLVAGTYHTPGFDHALHNSRLVAAVERAAQSGKRQSI